MPSAGEFLRCDLNQYKKQTNGSYNGSEVVFDTATLPVANLLYNLNTPVIEVTLSLMVQLENRIGVQASNCGLITLLFPGL